MLPFEKAFEIVLNSAYLLGTEKVDIANAANRVLAQDVKSDIDIPPFNKSAMDGYACRRQDLANELTIVEMIPAGLHPKEIIGPNQCAKIMTGAEVPQGADCVVMVEFTEKKTQNTVRFTAKQTAANICAKAEDIKAGQTVLSKGTLIKPQHIATLAAIGCANPCVAIRPKVGVIATGSELVEPSQRPSVPQLRDSNSFQLVAQVEAVGAVAENYGIVEDTREAIDAAVKKAISENDVVLISGGVSVGDFDFVPDILKQNNIVLEFEKILIKPGKPTVFGCSEGVFCFGMPGHPVSGFVMCELLVKPFLYKLMGYDFKPLDINVPLEASISRKKAGRPSWMPVVITDKGTARPVEYHGSAHFGALCGADGLICIPKGAPELKEGTVVSVRHI
ncbi:MAG: molybdopterin molybdotransferase MoeA [Planctomycetota bacterium]|nr:MAG: molybdopterin molybdotransferase MoeA [Planctomycetota bacterium]